MPLTSKGEHILAHMRDQYGHEKGTEVFYASRNAGTITGVDDDYDAMCARVDKITDLALALHRRVDAYLTRCGARDDESLSPGQLHLYNQERPFGGGRSTVVLQGDA